MEFYVGQVNSFGQKIVAIENGKVCVTDPTAADYRYAASRRWYKITSPILPRIFSR